MLERYEIAEVEDVQHVRKQLLGREPSGDYTPEEWNRLQTYDAVGGKFWVGDNGEQGKRSQVQSVWAAAEDFRRYVNKLLDTFGHLTYAELSKFLAETPSKD